MFSWNKAVVFLATASAVVNGELTYPQAATKDWVEITAAVYDNNGVFIAPDESIVVTISESCQVVANNPVTGFRDWIYAPTDTTLKCFGGVSFNYEWSTRYIVFAASEIATETT
jgi:hypothetical protein